MTKKMNTNFTIKKLSNKNLLHHSYAVKKTISPVIELPRLNIQTTRTRHAVYSYGRLY